MIFCYRCLLKSKDIRFDQIFRTCYSLVCLFLIYCMFYFFLYFLSFTYINFLFTRNISENLKIFHHKLCARYLWQSIQLNSWKIKGVFFFHWSNVCLFVLYTMKYCLNRTSMAPIFVFRIVRGLVYTG